MHEAAYACLAWVPAPRCPLGSSRQCASHCAACIIKGCAHARFAYPLLIVASCNLHDYVQVRGIGAFPALRAA